MISLITFFQLHEKAGGTVCQYCGDAFMNIENHIATWHKTEQPWKCDLCDFKHATKVGLKNHKLYYHPKEGTRYMSTSIGPVCFFLVKPITPVFWVKVI